VPLSTTTENDYDDYLDQETIRMNWSIAEAKAKLSALVEKTKDGPQTVTKNGRPVAVVVSAEEWARKTKREGTLWEFFRNSPLVDSGIVIERRRSGPRKLDL
jgi:prevent-host-death family protein